MCSASFLSLFFPIFAFPLLLDKTSRESWGVGGEGGGLLSACVSASLSFHMGSGTARMSCGVQEQDKPAFSLIR